MSFQELRLGSIFLSVTKSKKNVSYIMNGLVSLPPIFTILVGTLINLRLQ